MPLLTASKLALLYADLEVFSDITVEVPERARIGLVGPNGGGKTSLVRVLVGELTPNSGAVHRSAGLRIGSVAQTPSRVPAGTLEDEVMTAYAELRVLEDELADSALGIQQADEAGRRRAERRYSSLLQRYEALGGYDYRNLMERVTTGVGLTPETLATPAQAASGGERTRAALATALLTNPDLLVLDEPTNYLDFDGLAWLESFLESVNHAYLVVSHDRYFLDKVVDRVWELDRGRIRSFRGNFTRFQALRAEQAKRQHEVVHRVAVVFDDVVVGHVHVRERAALVRAGQHAHAPVLGRGVIQGEPAGALAHRLDRPVGRILVHALGGADVRGLHQQRVAEHLHVGSQDLRDDGDYGGVGAERPEQIVVLDQAVDLADAVAGVFDPLLSPRHPRLDLHAQRAGVAPAVRVLPDAVAERRDPLRIDQVLHHQVAVAVEPGQLLVRQADGRRRLLTHDL